MILIGKALNAFHDVSFKAAPWDKAGKRTNRNRAKSHLPFCICRGTLHSGAPTKKGETRQKKRFDDPLKYNSRLIYKLLGRKAHFPKS